MCVDVESKPVALDTTTGADRWPRSRALERAYEDHAPAALDLAYVLTGDRDRAQDLVHDAFERVSGRFLNLTAPERFRGYLYRTMVNLCRDEARREDRGRRNLHRYDQTARHDPLDEEVERRHATWELLLGLPPRQRAALFLRYYEDRSEEETAHLLGCSRSAVKSLVLRGLRHLRDRGGEA